MTRLSRSDELIAARYCIQVSFSNLIVVGANKIGDRGGFAIVDFESV